MQLKVTFLGTGTSQGVPVIGCGCLVCHSTSFLDKRLRSSILIHVNNLTILIDIGPDFRYQFLRSNYYNIDSILFTHNHRDHTAGLDDLRPIYYANKKPIELYGESKVFDALKNDFSYIFKGVNYPGKPQFNFNLVDNRTFYISNIEVQPIRVLHHRLPILGYRIGSFAYITDANYISNEEKKKLLGLKVLIINSLQREKHISHYNLEEALEVIKELAPQKAYLTHIGHGMGLHNEVEKELPKNVFISYDNLEILI